jgi:hypothetical protein
LTAELLSDPNVDHVVPLVPLAHQAGATRGELRKRTGRGIESVTLVLMMESINRAIRLSYMAYVLLVLIQFLIEIEF